MSRKEKPQITAFAPREVPSRPFLAGWLGLLGLLLLLALLDYSPFKNPLFSTQDIVMGSMGQLGIYTAFNLFSWVGLSAWVFPLAFFALAYLFIGRFSYALDWKRVLGFMAFVISFSGLWTFVEAQLLPMGFLDKHYPNYFIQGLGGLIGFLSFYGILIHNLGPLGSILVLVAVLSLGLYGTFSGTPLWSWIKKRRAQAKAIREEKQEVPLPEKPFLGLKKMLPRRKEALSTQEVLLAEETPVEEPLSLPLKEAAAVEKPLIVDKKPAKPIRPVGAEKSASGLKIVTSEPTQKAIDLLPTQKGDYIFPTLNLLSQPPPPCDQSLEDHQERAEALLQTLGEFGVKVNLGEIHTGPVITRYEVTPAPGVRVEKIAALDKNIALGLKATSVRILAPVPGKGSVGVEIPNRNPSPVCLREIIESTAWAHANAEIPVVLGKDVTGKPIVADLTKMPHLLIAGSTGSGKTVCINAVIASLLYHSSPEDVRFIMVDPKIVEMQLYNSLPHMLIPVVTNPKLVPGALKWLIAEMERRYQRFAQMGVRNIAGFNAKVMKDKEEEKKAKAMEAELSAEERAAIHTIEVPREIEMDVPKKKLPYIVCIIDELADLMMVAPADIEMCVARLAQLARAAGIHLILATQRPSVNVITGVIKANLPSRIAFKVASKVDSRTILDVGGADALIGRGDMLFTPPGASTLVRAQGAFVSDDEIHGIVEFLKRNGPPQFVEEIQREVESSGKDDDDEAGEEASDELIPAALDVLRTTQRASTSILQRKLSIGYNRAARIMEILEDRGIVGPENGAKPREILRDLTML